MTCPVCNQEIEHGSTRCPRCGAQLVPTLSKAQRKGGTRTTLVLFVVAVACTAAFVALILSWRQAQLDSSSLEREALESSGVEEEAQVEDTPEMGPPRVEVVSMG